MTPTSNPFRCYTIAKSGGHTYCFVYDDWAQSLYGLCREVLRLYLGCKTTWLDVAAIRKSVCEQLDGKCEGV